MTNATLLHSRTQHPVGEGLFHTGALGIVKPLLNYVYDCGSMDQTALRREVERYVRRIAPNPVDALFLSHLDNETVCGLSHLLAMTQVSCAIIPYMSPIERLLMVAKGVWEGNLDANAVELLSDPIEWLSERGVGMIVLVESVPAPPDLRLAPSDWNGELPGLLDPSQASALWMDCGWIREKGESHSLANGSEVIRVGCYIPFFLCTLAGSVLNWQFQAFVHADAKRLAIFRARAERECGLGLLQLLVDRPEFHVWLETVQDGTRRRSLAKSYLPIRGNQWVSSLSLYSGPICHDFVLVAKSTGLPGSRKSGWLGVVNTNVAINSCLSCLGSYQMESVGTISLPNRGATRNEHLKLDRVRRAAMIVETRRTYSQSMRLKESK
jgi:hypothetical protein